MSQNNRHLKLYQNLVDLPDPQFDQLLFSLAPPRGNVPPSSSSRSNRVNALLDWASSNIGCGLEHIELTYNEIIRCYPLNQNHDRVSSQELKRNESNDNRAFLNKARIAFASICSFILISILVPILLMENPPFLMRGLASIFQDLGREEEMGSQQLITPEKINSDSEILEKAKLLDPAWANYSITSLENPFHITFLDNASGKRYGERIQGVISGQSNEEPGRGWLRIRCREGQKIIFASVKGSVGVLVYDKNGNIVDLAPSRSLRESESIFGFLTKVSQGKDENLVYKVELQNLEFSEIELDIAVFCE